MVGRNIKRAETSMNESVFLVFVHSVECLYRPLFWDITVVRHHSLKSLENKRQLKIRNLFDHTSEELLFCEEMIEVLEITDLM